MKRVLSFSRDNGPGTATYGRIGRRFHCGRALLVLLGVAMVPGCADTSAETRTEVLPPTGLGSGMPHLVADGESALLSWLEPADSTDTDGAWRLATARFEDGAWSSRADVVERSGMFVNWADFPSVTTSSGNLYAHWLQRGPEGGYDYAVRMRSATDDSGPWSEGFTLHDDSNPVEHGFVSSVSLPGGRIGMVWLDGRDFMGEDPHEMQVRYREVGPDGPATPEVLLDDRVCDCCQTDIAVSGEDLVAVYRDRSDAEIRDISVVRSSGSEWSEPVRVHDDGWEIAGCPVNGPAIDANGAEVVVAWFTGAQEEPRVNVAFSEDGGRSFSPPMRVDAGAPVGRVDVSLISVPQNGGPTQAAVSWIERTDSEGGADVRLRVMEDGTAGEAVVVSATTSARTSGFPQMIRLGSELLLAWTDTDANRVVTKTVQVEALH